MEHRSSREERNRLFRLLSLELLFADEVCAGLLTDEKLLAAMARFEAALARASAQCGLLPSAHAEVIARVSDTARFDAVSLAREGRSGTLAIPFVKQLTAQVAAVSPEAARHVHAGATSQDVIDTAVALCLKPATGRVLDLTRKLGNATAALAGRHANTRTAARTLLQPALPVTFGWKAAVWLSMLSRSFSAVRVSTQSACVLQFGGPSGTLSSFEGKGSEVLNALAQELALPASLVPWHSARDRFARLGAELAILAGSAAKIGRDVSLLMQPEVGEAAEAAKAGRGGSSSMAHKRNPALSMLALEAAQRTPGLAATLLAQLAPEHERGLGQWQSQWLTLRELVLAAASGVAAMAEVLAELEVNEERMRANLESLLRAHAGDSTGAAAAMIESALAGWVAASAPGTAL